MGQTSSEVASQQWNSFPGELRITSPAGSFEGFKRSGFIRHLMAEWRAALRASQVDSDLTSFLPPANFLLCFGFTPTMLREKLLLVP